MWKPLGMTLLLLASCTTPAIDLQLVETAPTETSIGSDDLPEFHAVWLEMIEGARDSIELAHFYASNEQGSRLEPVVLALEAAARRGVQVRFLVDERFYGTYPETLDRLAHLDQVQVRRLDLKATSGGVLHSKYMLVDRDLVCLGSANFDWRALEHIQELGVKTRNTSIASAVRDVFELDWWLAGAADESSRPEPTLDPAAFPIELHMTGGQTVHVTPVFSPRGLLPSEELWDLPHLLAWIDDARSSLSIQVMTFRMTDRDGKRFEALESALLRAAGRGVQVRLLVADWGKRSGTIEGLKELTLHANVAVRMATLPPASSGHIPFARVIHSKYMIVDEERCWIGSSNWERGYFHASRNVGLLLEGPALAQRLTRYFEQGWRGPYSYPVDPDTDYEVPRIGD